MRLTGYTSTLGVAPGETIDFMVSCEAEHFSADLVRLIHGDRSAAGPGFKERPLPASFAGSHPGRVQRSQRGSHAFVECAEAWEGIESVTLAAWVLATMPGARAQAILAQGRPAVGHGAALVLSADGELCLWLGDGDRGAWRLGAGRSLAGGEWQLVLGGYDAVARQIFVEQWALRSVAGEPRGARAGRAVERGRAIEPGAALVIGAATGDDGAGIDAHFNGRISAPAVFACALEEGAIEALRGGAAAGALGLPLVAAWDFAADIGSTTITDVSGHGRHGATVNLPTRGVVDHTFDGQEVSFRLASGGYGAIHFHEDDLEDAGWEADASFTVPHDLPSGIYAARLRAAGAEDHLPFVVRPAPTGPRAAIAFLVPTLTYRAYANYLDVERGGWDTSDLPHLDRSINPDSYSYILEQQLFGLYDRHADGSATCYGSSLRPILNLRPDWRYRVWGAPTLFAADLYLVDWLDEKGYEVDCITDDDLHREGAALLDPYRVILTGSHPEYWTAQMLDALQAYLEGGGRLMYLGGNGFFGVASIDPLRPHVAEVRRWGTSWPFEAPPPERYHSTTGEPGGTWRNRGRAPNRLVGVGTCAAGFDSGARYVRGPQAGDPRAAFVFEGLEGDEPIGDVPSLQVRHGAAGYEIDRHDPALGSPRDALVLASSVGHSAHYHAMLDEQLWFVDEVDGMGAGTPGTGGEEVHPFIHADLVLWPRARGGAVFSVGSMAWQGCLSHNGYENSVSRVTQNVLERFLREEPIG